MTEKHFLEALIEGMVERDNARINEMQNMFPVGPTLENRLWLADERAKDALSAIAVLARYIAEQERRAAECAAAIRGMKSE